MEGNLDVSEIKISGGLDVTGNAYFLQNVGVGGGLTLTGVSKFGKTIHANNVRVGEDLVVTGSSTVNKASPGTTPGGNANFDVGGIITGDVGYFNKLYVTGEEFAVKKVIGGGGISAAGTGTVHNVGIFSGNHTFTTGQLVYLNKGGYDQNGRFGVNNLTPRYKNINHKVLNGESFD